MALMKCPECGKEISDKAISCPNCGCPVEPEMAEFTLQREKKAFFSAVKYECFLDYQPWGVIKNGESLRATLPCGTHHLKLVDKSQFNKTVYDNDFYLDSNGLVLSFSASTKIQIQQAFHSNETAVRFSENRNPFSETTKTISYPTFSKATSNGKTCPKCGGIMTIQTVSEARKAGCGTVILYLLLALTIFGLLIVIPLMLRKKTETATYAVCQRCGYKKRIS